MPRRPDVWARRLGLLLLLLAIYVQSYNGRRDVVHSARSLCRHYSTDLARIANWMHTDQLANLDVARDPTVPPSTRAIRAHEATVEARVIHGLYEHIDVHAIPVLDPTGQRYVRSLSHPFDCDRTLPSPSPLRFFS